MNDWTCVSTRGTWCWFTILWDCFALFACQRIYMLTFLRVMSFRWNRLKFLCERETGERMYIAKMKSAKQNLRKGSVNEHREEKWQITVYRRKTKLSARNNETTEKFDGRHGWLYLWNFWLDCGFCLNISIWYVTVKSFLGILNNIPYNKYDIRYIRAGGDIIS